MDIDPRCEGTEARSERRISCRLDLTVGTAIAMFRIFCCKKPVQGCSDGAAPTGGRRLAIEAIHTYEPVHTGAGS